MELISKQLLSGVYLFKPVNSYRIPKDIVKISAELSAKAIDSPSEQIKLHSFDRSLFIDIFFPSQFFSFGSLITIQPSYSDFKLVSKSCNLDPMKKYNNNVITRDKGVTENSVNR